MTHLVTEGDTYRQLCPYHPEFDFRHAWACPGCLAEMRDAIRRAWELLYTAIGDSPPAMQQDLRPGDWTRLKYGALDAMEVLEHTMQVQGQSMSRPREK